jgi:hypothetical protein
LGFLPNSHLTFEKRGFQSFTLADARVGASLRQWLIMRFVGFFRLCAAVQ